MAVRDTLRSLRQHIVSMAADDIEERAAAAVGHRFADAALLRAALTHPSVVTRREAGSSYERLEFLGDRVLGLVVADLLFEAFPGEAEGELAQRYAALVCRDSLAEVARDLGLGPLLVMARGEDDSGGRDNPANLADACEALIGALYRDAGIDEARRFVESHWLRKLRSTRRPPRDAKTALQEWAQGRGKPLPRYRTLASTGPAHSPLFEVEVSIDDFPPATASGPSKRVAEQAAAEILLSRVSS